MDGPPEVTPTPPSDRRMDWDYFTHPPGFVKIVELILGLVTFTCVAATLTKVGLPWFAVYFLFVVSIVSWLCTLTFLLFILLKNRIRSFKIGRDYRWFFMELLVGATICLSHLSSSSVLAAFLPGTGQKTLLAGMVFGYLTTMSYALGAYLSFADWRMACPEQHGVSGAMAISKNVNWCEQQQERDERLENVLYYLNDND